MPNYELDECYDFPGCPYCDSRRGCSHLLLMVDLVFRQGLHGRGYELFENLSTVPEELDPNGDLGDFTFEDAVDRFRAAADDEIEEELDEAPGQSTVILYLFIRTEVKMAEVLSSLASTNNAATPESSDDIDDSNYADEADDADEDNDETDEDETDEDDTDDPEESAGQPCPICGRLVDVPAGEFCKHLVAFSWDDHVEWFGNGKQLEESLNSLGNLVDEDGSEHLFTRETGTSSVDPVLLTSYLDGHISLPDFLGELPQCQEGETTTTPGMLGGCGRIFFSANLSQVIEYCRKITAANSTPKRPS